MNLKILAYVLLAIGVLLVVPFTRPLVLFVLPLGRGVDDFLMFSALVVGGLLWIASRITAIKNGLTKTRIVFVFIVATAILTVALLSLLA